MVRNLPKPPELGPILRELRMSRSLTQEQVALRSGLSTTYISLIETGKKNPTFISISAVLAVLSVSWTDFGMLLDRTRDRPPHL